MRAPATRRGTSPRRRSRALLRPPPRRRPGLPWAVMLAGVVACASPASAPQPMPAGVEAERQRQYDEAAARLLAHMERVSRVGSRVTVAAAPLCGADVKPFVGIVSASRTSLTQRLGRHDAWIDASAALRDAWELDGSPEVLAVLEGSPAAAAGILPGDHVLDLRAENDRADSPLWIEVERGRRRIRARLPYVPECRFPVVATIGDLVNAHVDGETVLVTTGLLRFVESDDELAAVIGHELAHRILGHRRSRFRSRERAADYLGVYLAARAGFAPEAAPAFVRRLAAEHPELISDRASPAHPGTARRVAALDLAVAEIRDKQRRGEALWPRPDGDS